MIKISQHDLYIMLVSSVRYALGRSSYIVGETASLVQRYGPRLSYSERQILRKDIQEAIGSVSEAEGRRGLGMKMDEDVWQALLDDRELWS